MKPTFSQRFGHQPIDNVLQHDSMSMDLKNALWNTLYENYFKFLFVGISINPHFERFLRIYWVKYLKEPIDTIPRDFPEAKRKVRGSFYHHEWYISYNFLEFVAGYLESLNQPIYKEINLTLEEELSSYRFVSGQLTDITSSEEIKALEDAIADTSFLGVATHLSTALSLYSDRENPDYRNSIKESFSAVESMAKIINGNSSGTLVDALKAISSNGTLHKALKDGFIKLYSYAGDADGIRHGIMEDSNLTQADARYFLLSCTSFVNYLKSKM